MDKQIDINTLNKQELSELNNSVLMQIGSLEASKQQLIQTVYAINATLQRKTKEEEDLAINSNLPKLKKLNLPSLKNVSVPEIGTYNQTPNATTQPI